MNTAFLVEVRWLVIDYFNFPSLLSKETNDIRLKYRAIFEKEVLPDLNKLYEKGEYPHSLCDVLAKSGANNYGYSKPFGTGFDAMTFGMICMEAARIDASFSTIYLVNHALFGHTLEEFGSEE